MKCLNRHIELFEAQKLPHTVLEGVLYYQSSGVIRAWGPASTACQVTQGQGLLLCRQLRGHLVITTGGFTDDPGQGWYAVICEKFRPLEELKAKYRSEINRGLRNCQVRQVEPDIIAQHGYEVYNQAIQHYASYYDAPKTKDQWRQEHEACQAFGDIVHYWGVFHEDQLIGYAQNMLFDRVEVNYWIVRLHPAFLSLYPGYALFHKMNEFYLQTQSFEYVNDGWRSLLHETQIQDFLVRKFAFRKAHCPLSVVYKPAVGLLVRACYPWRNVAKKIDLRLAGLCKLEAIRRGEDTNDDAPAPAADGKEPPSAEVVVQEQQIKTESPSPDRP